MQQRILINRIKNGSIEVEDEEKEISVETDGGRRNVAYISLKNYGVPVHLYFSVFPVNAGIESVISFLENNFYVEGEEKIPIRIDLPYEKEYKVQIGVTASYGLSKEVFSLKISPKTITSEGEEEVEESRERDFVEVLGIKNILGRYIEDGIKGPLIRFENRAQKSKIFNYFVERIYSEWEIFLFLAAVLFFIIAMILLLI